MLSYLFFVCLCVSGRMIKTLWISMTTLQLLTTLWKRTEKLWVTAPCQPPTVSSAIPGLFKIATSWDRNAVQHQLENDEPWLGCLLSFIPCGIKSYCWLVCDHCRFRKVTLKMLKSRRWSWATEPKSCQTSSNLNVNLWKLGPKIFHTNLTLNHCPFLWPW